MYTKDISSVKLSLKFGKPTGLSNVVNDFHSLLDRIQSLEQEVTVGGADENISIIHSSKQCPGSSLLKLRHGLFSKVLQNLVNEQDHLDPLPATDNLDLEDDAENAAGACLSTYTIANWPTSSPEAARALEAIKDSHIVNIPPFYDMRYMILPPNSYRRHLEGAVAEIRFTLAHHIIGKGNNLKNVFTADIVDIVIIHGPPARAVTPRRARVFAIHPSSPSKKRRLDN
ncbi:hypothetical protein C8R42DRAFT_568978 [Lentinula raphanica]|nr:hypothetical protein C8R42DRAFT_568978 [Lentinula raphanica]